MAEYIEREVLKQQLQLEGDCGHVSTLADVLDIVDFVSTTDVAPVRHGKWISLTECANEGVYCSVCNKKVYKADYAWSNKRIKVRSNYCPNCGAKMDGGADHEAD